MRRFITVSLMALALAGVITSCHKDKKQVTDVRVEDMLALLDQGASGINADEVMQYLPVFADSYEAEVKKAISGKSDVATVAELVRNSDKVTIILQQLDVLKQTVHDHQKRFEMDRLIRRISTKHDMLDDFARERALARRRARGDDRYDYGDRERMDSMRDSMERLEKQLRDTAHRIEGFVPNDKLAEEQARKRAEERAQAQEQAQQQKPSTPAASEPAKPAVQTPATPAAPTAQKPASVEQKPTQAPAAPTVKSRFHVVAGSFPTMEQARQGCAQIPGCTIRAYTSDGVTKYRLIAGTASTREEANAISKRMKCDTWIWEEK